MVRGGRVVVVEWEGGLPQPGVGGRGCGTGCGHRAGIHRTGGKGGMGSATVFLTRGTHSRQPVRPTFMRDGGNRQNRGGPPSRSVEGN